MSKIDPLDIMNRVLVWPDPPEFDERWVNLVGRLCNRLARALDALDVALDIADTEATAAHAGDETFGKIEALREVLRVEKERRTRQ